jgi:hypothetical protein
MWTCQLKFQASPSVSTPIEHNVNTRRPFLSIGLPKKQTGPIFASGRPAVRGALPKRLKSKAGRSVRQLIVV